MLEAWSSLITELTRMWLPVNNFKNYCYSYFSNFYCAGCASTWLLLLLLIRFGDFPEELCWMLLILYALVILVTKKILLGICYWECFQLRSLKIQILSGFSYFSYSPNKDLQIGSFITIRLLLYWLSRQNCSINHSKLHPNSSSFGIVLFVSLQLLNIIIMVQEKLLETAWVGERFGPTSSFHSVPKDTNTFFHNQRVWTLESYKTRFNTVRLGPILTSGVLFILEFVVLLFCFCLCFLKPGRDHHDHLVGTPASRPENFRAPCTEFLTSSLATMYLESKIRDLFQSAIGKTITWSHEGIHWAQLLVDFAWKGRKIRFPYWLTFFFLRCRSCCSNEKEW